MIAMHDRKCKTTRILKLIQPSLIILIALYIIQWWVPIAKIKKTINTQRIRRLFHEYASLKASFFYGSEKAARPIKHQ